MNMDQSSYWLYFLTDALPKVFLVFLPGNKVNCWWNNSFHILNHNLQQVTSSQTTNGCFLYLCTDATIEIQRID